MSHWIQQRYQDVTIQQGKPWTSAHQFQTVMDEVHRQIEQTKTTRTTYLYQWPNYIKPQASGEPRFYKISPNDYQRVIQNLQREGHKVTDFHTHFVVSW